MSGQEQDQDYDRTKEVVEFDQTKAGVKGLVDSGIASIPRFFIHPPESLSTQEVEGESQGSSCLVEVPVVDFRGESWGVLVEKVRKACEEWGFFELVNHGIPPTVMDELLEGIRKFHEQPTEEKTRFYSRDMKQKVRYYCNGNLLVARAATWRDSLSCDYRDGHLNPDELPPVCRSVFLMPLFFFSGDFMHIFLGPTYSYGAQNKTQKKGRKRQEEKGAIDQGIACPF